MADRTVKGNELAEAIAKKIGKKAPDVLAVLHALPDVVLGYLSEGVEVDLPNFGLVFPYLRTARAARDPIFHVKVQIPARLGCRFRFKPLIRKKLYLASRDEIARYQLRFHDE